MRPDSNTPSIRARRALSTGLPAAVAGSLALVLGATPAHAAEPVRQGDHRMPRSVAAVDSALRVPTTTGAGTHTVAPGDTVSSIAAQYGLNIGDLLAINGLSWSSSTIYPGQVLLLNAAPVPAAPTPSAPSAAYVVVAGDTISAIASRHGMSTDAVLAANGLDRSSIIYPGQSISLPTAGSTATPASAPPAAPVAALQAPASTYVIVSGDTISAIASHHGVATDALLAANGLDRSSIIYPGQSVAIPGAAVVLAANTTPAVVSSSSDLDAEQIANAKVIIAVGRELGIPDRGIATALGTAMQESWLRNLDWGDRDSLGLFQQRPSTGWGTEAEVRDTVRATKVFFGGASDPNGSLTRGLLDIPGWESMSFADAAQAVQISAYPDRYAQWEQPAYSWLAVHG